MLVYIIGAIVVLLIVVFGLIYMMTGNRPESTLPPAGTSRPPVSGTSSMRPPMSAWDAARIKQRLNNESDDAWSKRIFGTLRQNPAQSQTDEPAQVNLNWLLAGKNTLDISTAGEFAKGAAIWYKDSVVTTGLASGDGTVLNF